MNKKEDNKSPGFLIYNSIDIISDLDILIEQGEAEGQFLEGKAHNNSQLESSSA